MGHVISHHGACLEFSTCPYVLTHKWAQLDMLLFSSLKYCTFLQPLTLHLSPSLHQWFSSWKIEEYICRLIFGDFAGYICTIGRSCIQFEREAWILDDADQVESNQLQGEPHYLKIVVQTELAGSSRLYKTKQNAETPMGTIMSWHYLIRHQGSIKADSKLLISNFPAKPLCSLTCARHRIEA